MLFVKFHTSTGERVIALLTAADIPDGLIAAAKLSFDPATQAELDAHATVAASGTTSGHVLLDNVTVKVDAVTGKLYVVDGTSQQRVAVGINNTMISTRQKIGFTLPTGNTLAITVLDDPSTSRADVEIKHKAHTGDVTGSESSTALTVVAIRGTAISATAPTSGQILYFDGTNWKPFTLIPASFTINSVNPGWNVENAGAGGGVRGKTTGAGPAINGVSASTGAAIDGSAESSGTAVRAFQSGTATGIGLDCDGSEARHHRTITANYTITAADNVILVDTAAAVGNITVTLPAAASNVRKRFRIIDIGNNANVRTITIARAGADTFTDGATTKVINTANKGIEIEVISSSKFYASVLTGA